MNEGVSPARFRAGNVDRERVIDALRSAVEDGRLDLAEFEERANRVYSARTLGELPPVTEDLLPAAAQPIQLRREPVTALFSNDARGGRWVVPDALPVIAAFGTAELDLRTALLVREHTTVYASAVFGRINVEVPEGVEVRVRGWSFLGGRRATVRRPQRENAPVLEFRGFSLFGSLRVRAPKRRRAWLPWRRQRKELG
ncbi:hypothetical protein F4561_000601 [Lipingzhangella halophila]|uniref:Cell wall-active antibiotics response 4TMS YvqF n=1 Tax=Lipingzhangella halophila TaxID=1783352 RepID=A0A7W7RD24_9ACTN|nr:DUF1707 domain-containing protein [Lipingzhangella halophila]MBB4929781.1 hypothetical protein [Lipingzhangella halophila]